MYNTWRCLTLQTTQQINLMSHWVYSDSLIVVIFIAQGTVKLPGLLEIML